VNIGRKIVGYCSGYFGRDDYKDKMIIFEGKKWIVCKYIDKDEVACVNFDSEEEKNRMIDEWESGDEE